MIASATELVEGYRNKTVSPVEATQAALAAIDAYDGRVNAFVLVDHEGALAAAKQSEARWQAGEPLGPGDGVPTSIKDALWTRGWPTLRGSKLIDAAGPWDEDAPCVARLRETGAVIVGKTTTPEYSWKGVTDSLRHGATGNPWDPEMTAGGSSGGSATAVGLGMGPWSVGTDGGGSVRIPAAFTGTVALKPTYGLIPLYPPSPFGTLSHAGPMTRTVRDTAALMDVITGFDARDWAAMPTPSTSFLSGLDDGVAGLRVGYSADLGFVRNDPEVDAAVRAAVDVLAGAGAHVDEVDPGFSDPVEAFHVLWFTGEAKVLAALRRHRGPGRADRPRTAPHGVHRNDVVGRRLPRRDGRPDAAGWADGPVPPALRRARDADAAVARVPRRPGRTRRFVVAGLDELDAVHVSLQSDPAAGAQCAVRVHHCRIADRAAYRRRTPHRCLPVARRPGVPGRDRLAPAHTGTAGRGGLR